jgi:prohibitin 2
MENIERLRGIAGGMPKPPPGGAKLIGLGGAMLGAGTLLFQSLFNVEPGYKAIMFNRFSLMGKKGVDKERIIEEGTHIAVPWFQRPIMFDCRTRANTFTSLTGSKDLQMVNISVRVLTKPMADDLPRIYDFLGDDKDMDARVLPSVVPEVLKAVVARYNASQLVTQRDQISGEVRANLAQRLSQVFHIYLEDVSLTNISFGPEYTAAVESKQVAQQNAERARYQVERAKQDKKSVIVKAQGEADAAKMINEAMNNNPGYLELRRIEKAREVAAVVSKSANKVYLDSSLLMFNMGGEVVDEMKGNEIQDKISRGR